MISVIRHFILIVFVLLITVLVSKAQDKPLIQMSGVVVNIDTSHMPISFATVYNKSMKLGGYANMEGWYTLLAKPGDTILFSSLGYYDLIVTVPSDYTSDVILYNALLASKSYLLTEAIVYPWGTRDQFRQAFIHLNIPDDDLTRAYYNLSASNMEMVSASLLRDGTESNNIYFNNLKNSYYTKGQSPQNNLLNPLAWAQFFDDWSKGKLKIK